MTTAFVWIYVPGLFTVLHIENRAREIAIFLIFSFKLIVKYVLNLIKRYLGSILRIVTSQQISF